MKNYKWKISLINEDDDREISMKFDDKYLSEMKELHSNFSWFDEMLNTLRKYEEGEAFEGEHSVSELEPFFESFKSRVISRREKTAEELMIVPIEEDIMITKEDVEDLSWLYGAPYDRCYEKLKEWYLR
jgi:hypothetical protein